MPGSAGLRGRDRETRGRGELAFRCSYISKTEADELDQMYDSILAQLVRMIEHPEQWTIRTGKTQAKNAGV
jgi:hypothetical protein